MLKRCVLLLLGATVVLSGCATSDEWATWKSNTAHFASVDHLYFSMRNREGDSPWVTRQDIGVAREQGWWGFPVTVGQEQIVER